MRKVLLIGDFQPERFKTSKKILENSGFKVITHNEFLFRNNLQLYKKRCLDSLEEIDAVCILPFTSKSTLIIGILEIAVCRGIKAGNLELLTI